MPALCQLATYLLRNCGEGELRSLKVRLLGEGGEGAALTHGGLGR